MRIIDQSCDFMQLHTNALQLIEAAGRTCYRSEDAITEKSAEAFAKKILKLGHESVIEHVSVSMRFVTNRGVTHELVRHRLASFSQESTRYVKYDDIEVIKPVWFDISTAYQQEMWQRAMELSERHYGLLIKDGWRPEQAREVLPNSLATRIVVTANVREWRHIFKLRTSPKVHPQIRKLMLMALEKFQHYIPVLFDNI